MRCVVVTPVLVASLLAGAARAQQQPSEAEVQAFADSMRRIASRLEFQRGHVELQSGLATLEVPEGFRYLDPKQTRIVLEDLWGNPEGTKTLGMLFPRDVSPASENGWGVVITYDEDGYVKDDEAGKVDYAKLLKEMQEGARQESGTRRRMGYPGFELVGWAEPPHYDEASHKLYWAKHLKFTDAEQHTLNYNVRVLGRRGVLVLNAVGSMDQMPDIQRGMTDVMGFVDFSQGYRYVDFNPGVDKVAAYGIAALVAGKVAAKVGLFKVIVAALVAAKKLVVVAVLGIVAFIKRLFAASKTAPKPEPAK